MSAAESVLTCTMGRVLESSPINTKGQETLLNLVENTKGDNFDLYYKLFMYNQNTLEQLDMAFGRSHEVYRKQLFGVNGGMDKRMRLSQKFN
ncbi:hypothetical protein V6N13_094703 [Hibiscus sabdariffa]|uniref:TYRAAT2-like C-terminal domain-containing protein n=2 Tax=Hibiscus sabdariffa TaxID=183260 RepID=A0ABR2B8Z2_9ROSI